MAPLLAWESLCSCGLIIFKAGQQLFGFLRQRLVLTTLPLTALCS